VKKPASTLSLSDLRRDLARASNPRLARSLALFFKTGKGEYGEGDEFCGITVPELRKIAKRYLHLGLTDLKKCSPRACTSTVSPPWRFSYFNMKPPTRAGSRSCLTSI
jgi:hypothetical protein